MGERLGGAAHQRATISGGDDHIIRAQNVQPCLHRVRGLGEDEPRARPLFVRERQVDVVDAEHAWHAGRQERERRPHEGQRRGVERGNSAGPEFRRGRIRPRPAFIAGAAHEEQVSAQ